VHFVICRPGLLNSLAGVISTLTNVYGSQGHHQFSTTSKSTIIITGATACVCGILTLVYKYWLLAAVKRRSEREAEREEAGKYDDVDKA
jgi:hypothetical protein